MPGAGPSSREARSPAGAAGGGGAGRWIGHRRRRLAGSSSHRRRGGRVALGCRARGAGRAAGPGRRRVGGGRRRGRQRAGPGPGSSRAVDDRRRRRRGGGRVPIRPAGRGRRGGRGRNRPATWRSRHRGRIGAPAAAGSGGPGQRVAAAAACAPAGRVGTKSGGPGGATPPGRARATNLAGSGRCPGRRPPVERPGHDGAGGLGAVTRGRDCPGGDQQDKNSQLLPALHRLLRRQRRCHQQGGERRHDHRRHAGARDVRPRPEQPGPHHRHAGRPEALRWPSSNTSTGCTRPTAARSRSSSTRPRPIT